MRTYIHTRCTKTVRKISDSYKLLCVIDWELWAFKNVFLNFSIFSKASNEYA